MRHFSSFKFSHRIWRKRANAKDAPFFLLLRWWTIFSLVWNVQSWGCLFCRKKLSPSPSPKSNEERNKLFLRTTKKNGPEKKLFKFKRGSGSYTFYFNEVFALDRNWTNSFERFRRILGWFQVYFLSILGSF